MAANPSAAPAHILPDWYDVLRRHVVLSLLIICEIVTNGGLVLMLVVHDVNDPMSWSWLEWLYAVTLPFGIGLVSGGIAVSLSQACADAFAQKRILAGVLFFLVMCFYGLIEVWASLVERSATSKPTPADLLAFQALNIAPSALTISAIVFAFMLPFSAIFVGFANRPKQLEDDETWEQKANRKVREAELKAKLATINGATAVGAGAQVGGFLRGISAAAKGEAITPASATRASGNAAAKVEDMDLDTRREGAAIPGGYVHPLDAASASDTQREGNMPRQAARALPRSKGPWKREDLVAYIAKEYPQVTLSDTAALEAVKTLGDNRKQGTAYVATISAVKAWARKHYGAPASEQVLELSVG